MATLSLPANGYGRTSPKRGRKNRERRIES